ncbi:cellulose biosynthesis cyclic di-GMP-binding regulatory protein BcsB [Lysinibacillus piscis]|uniref:Cellulose synthase subunit n=1 Tax=Lysinibacillus piscis TaxID=2518931 RepID=A0ABQ5NK18_9BACI|nr:cellulose biosynthesis cyclic di-GMP-binding regulatory protein BcsB [Lysinibacillus sp. KH24]GLC88610.1 hypothetical protein LYSBPC_17370 [Lysinibacillus sp. KH24]
MKSLYYAFMMMLSLLFLSTHVEAATISVDHQTLKIEESSSHQKPLLSQAIDLQGPSASRDFYYTLSKDMEPNNYSVTFHTQHSELLIAPSSFTIQIDDVSVKTVALTPEQLQQSITVILPKEALSKGTHKITASFYGSLKDGICVAPGNIGNWLRLDIMSSISTFDGEQQQWTLGSYPSMFLSYENSQTTLILPENASEATLNSGYQLAAYLSSNSVKNVQIKRENAIEQLTGPAIVLGAKDEFSTELMRKIATNANITYDKGVSLSIHAIGNTDATNHVPLLWVTATSPEEIQERIALLTDARLFQQLVGDTMVVDELPQLEKQSFTTIPFTKFGFEGQTLSSDRTFTPHYYISLPRLEADQEAVMRFKLKKAAILPTTAAKDQNDRQVELIVTINNVPHAIDLRKLESIGKDVYEAQLPIETNLLNKQAMTDIQFEVTGFQLEDPCETTNERYWLYIDGSSTLIMGNNEVTETSFSLKDFPNTFHEDTLIIVPDASEAVDGQMLLLYKELMMNGQMAQTTLVKNGAVTEKDLQQHAAIFVGELEQFTTLTKHTSTIPHTAEELAQQGFLPTTIAQSAFVTASFWQQQKPVMLLRLTEDTVQASEFLTNLKQENEVVKMAVATKEGQFVAGAKTATDVDAAQEEQSSVSAIVIAEFIGLIAVIGIALYFILRKRKKNEVTEEE